MKQESWLRAAFAEVHSQAELLDSEGPQPASCGAVEVHVNDWSHATSSQNQTQRNADAAVLAASVQRCLIDSGSFPLSDLVEGDGAFTWKLHVDVTVCADGGGLLDAVSLAVHAALADTALPKITLVATPGDGDEEGGVDAQVDEQLGTGRKLQLQDMPLSVTLHVIAGRLVLDATDTEEACAGGSITLAVTPDGAIAAMSTNSKPGVPCFTPTLVERALQTAVAVAAASTRLHSQIASLATPLSAADGTGTFDPAAAMQEVTPEGFPVDALSAEEAALKMDAAPAGFLKAAARKA